jgi:nucleoside-diphosphate-sugar epimerase
MKILFIGGTGFISTAVSQLAIDRGHELYHLNRGVRPTELQGVHQITADWHNFEEAKAALDGLKFDAVVDWIAFKPEDVERDLAMFRERTDQFFFISSASAYQKPPAHYIITESTPLYNPFWEYSRNKIACEERLLRAYREEEFPAVIVRPSHTYDPNLPLGLGGWGCYTLPDRLLRGKPVIVHGDGSALWVVTHSEDFGRGFLGLFGNEKTLGHAFHITSDEVLTWNQIYATIADALGVEANIVHIASERICELAPSHYGSLIGDKSWSVVFDNSKVKAWVPEYKAVIPFREGVKRTIKWYNADERRMTINDSINDEMDMLIAEYART